MFVCVCVLWAYTYVCKSHTELSVFKSVLRIHIISQQKIHITANKPLYFTWAAWNFFTSGIRCYISINFKWKLCRQLWRTGFLSHLFLNTLPIGRSNPFVPQWHTSWMDFSSTLYWKLENGNWNDTYAWFRKMWVESDDCLCLGCCAV